jgi:predicted short-subunit dehydrogenase-like oxidoreductase (DUF2520 family)
MDFVIGFIGAGKVGTSLGKYFETKDIKLSGYYSRSLDSSKAAADFTNSAFYTEIGELISDSNIIMITTPDDAIKKIWKSLKKYNLKDKIICHTSGSLSSDIFDDIYTSGAFGYSIHPMFAFSDKFTTFKNLKSAYFSIEGSEKYLPSLKKFFKSLGNEVFILSKDNKPLYHLASVTASNLVLSLINIACNYLEKCGVDSTKSLDALLPLVNNNIQNISEKGFIDALTGPIERGDAGTVVNHLKAIPLEHKSLYKILSLNLVNISKEKHKSKSYEQIEKILKEISYEK